MFLGNLDNFCFMGVLGRAVPETNNKLPEIVSRIVAHLIGLNLNLSHPQVFATYQMMFACLVPAIVLGAAGNHHGRTVCVPYRTFSSRS